jgi:predicted metalloprotease with PDZ domain
VTHVDKDSQAEVAGVKQGWTLCSVNGILVTDIKGLSDVLLAIKANDDRLVPMRFAWNSQSAFEKMKKRETIGRAHTVTI